MNTTLLPTHSLNDKWNLYYHLPDNKNWDLDSYKTIIGNMNYVEETIAINNAITEESIRSCMFFLMRKDITPLWEDKNNRCGGCFSYRILNKIVPNVWKNLIYMCCGESLTVNPEHNKHVNGITISPKKSFCIVKIWMNTIEFQDPEIIKPLKNLPMQGCIFKKHEPEF